MNSADANIVMTQLRDHDGDFGWIDPCRIATDTWREEAILRLSRDPQLEGGIALVEITLTEELPAIDEFSGIFAVDEIGIWWYDGDGHIDDPVWRQRVIPWRYVKGLTLHQIS